MKHFLYLFSLIILSSTIKSQCFQIESILVDACGGSQEGQNEMVIFKVGSAPLITTNMSVTWPNNNWLSLTQNAGTAAAIASVNSTILGCGFLKEPVASVLPANSKVLLITSTAWIPSAQSFVNLTDTLIVLFQTAGNTNGHFANYLAGGGLRTLSMTFSSPVGCTDAVTYDRALLVNQAGNIGGQDGGTVKFLPSGTASYVNYGCQAPFIPLIVDAGTPNNTVCLGSAQNFTATTSGPFNSVLWTLGAGATGTFAPTNSLVTTYTPGAGDAGTIKLYCNVKACASSTVSIMDSVNLTVLQIANPLISASSNTLCSGNSSTLSYSISNAANTGTTSVLWLPGSLTTPSISVNSATIYTVQITNSCGNNTATVSITAIPNPTVVLSNSSPTACAGSTFTLFATSNVNDYSWTNPVSTNSAVVVSANTTTTGIVTSSNVCGTDSKTYTLTITPIPLISVNNSNLSLCSGQSAIITATSNATTYTWQPGGSIQTNTISLNSAGVYTVNTSNLCGTASATVDVTINSIPTLSLASSSPSVCSNGQTAILSLSGSSGTFAWSNGGSASTTTINIPGVYTATVTTSSCGSAITSITVGTSPLPMVSISVPTTTVCAGSALTFTANSSDANYLWTGGATTQTVSVNTSSIVVTTTNACGSAQATQTLNFGPIPTVTLSSNALTLCSGQSATVQANTNTAVTYTWSNSANTNTVSLNAAGVYTVDVSNACGISSATVDVVVGALPNVTASASQTLLCSGQTSILSLTGSVGTYSWSNGATTATTSVTNAGIYTGTVTTTCGSAINSVTIASQVTPTVSISASLLTICSGQTSSLTAISNVNNYSWSTGSFTNNTVVNTSGVITVSVSNICGIATETINITSSILPVLTITPGSVLICPNETATLSVTGGSEPYTWSNSSNTGSVVSTNGGTVSVSSSNACGTSSAITVVNVTSLNANISANPTSGILPVVVSFTNNSNGANTYLWDFGNGNSAASQNVSAETYSAVGIYTVYLTAFNGSCSDTYSLMINVFNEEATLVVPNVFTPNGDGRNDIFKIYGKNIIEFNCTIFDRWGLQMFYWDDIRNGWDGTNVNKMVPDGTYFYIINAKDIDFKEIKKQGFLQLFQ